MLFIIGSHISSARQAEHGKQTSWRAGVSSHIIFQKQLQQFMNTLFINSWIFCFFFCLHFTLFFYFIQPELSEYIYIFQKVCNRVLFWCHLYAVTIYRCSIIINFVGVSTLSHEFRINQIRFFPDFKFFNHFSRIRSINASDRPEKKRVLRISSPFFPMFAFSIYIHNAQPCTIGTYDLFYSKISFDFKSATIQSELHSTRCTTIVDGGMYMYVVLKTWTNQFKLKYYWTSKWWRFCSLLLIEACGFMHNGTLN